MIWYIFIGLVISVACLTKFQRHGEHGFVPVLFSFLVGCIWPWVVVDIISDYITAPAQKGGGDE